MNFPDERILGRRGISSLFDRIANDCYGYARSLGASKELAQDCVQDVFLSLLERKLTFDHVRDAKHYCLTSVRNGIVDYARRAGVRRRNRLAVGQRWLRSKDSQDAPLELAPAVESAIEALPMNQREIVVLKVYQQMTFKSAATLLKVNANTLASRYRNALESLRLALSGVMEEEQ